MRPPPAWRAEVRGPISSPASARPRARAPAAGAGTRRPRRRAAAARAAPTGPGGPGGNDGNGSGGKGGSGGDGGSGDSGGWRRPAAAVAAGAAAGASLIARYRRSEAIAKGGAGGATTPTPPHHPPPLNPFARLDAVEGDIARLRRLVRDAFEAVTDASDRIDGPGGGGGSGGGAHPRRGDRAAAASAAGRFAALGALRRRAGAPAHQAVGGEGVSVEGEAVTDAVWARARGGAPALTLRSRLRALVHGPARGGKDGFLAQLDAGDGGGGGGWGGHPATLAPPPTLTKLLYSASLAPRARLLVAPLGARGSDVAATLNPAAGGGLSRAARHGCALHARAAGAALAARYAWPGATLTAARFEAPGGGATTLVQADGAVGARASVGVAASRAPPRSRRRPARRDPSPTPWSSPSARSSSSSDGDAGEPGPGLAAAALAALALPSGAVASAWVCAGSGPTLGAPLTREWGLTLASRPAASGEGWLVAADGGRGGAAGGEASLTLRPGGGALAITPGVTWRQDGGRGSVAAVACRSVVSF